MVMLDLTCLRNLNVVKKQQLESDMEQWTGSQLGKEYNDIVCCHSTYSTSKQRTSREMPGWMKNNLEIRLSGEIGTISCR